MTFLSIHVGEMVCQDWQVPGSQVNQDEGMPRCLKITEKVSFNIASEASYVYILSGQKLFKNAKKWSIWRVFEKLTLAVKQCYQTGQF